MKRLIQLLLCIHTIHHIHYSYGYKFVFIPIGYFSEYNKRTGKGRIKYLSKAIKGSRVEGTRNYHNCTITGVY